MSLFQLQNVSVSELLSSDGSLPSSRRSALKEEGNPCALGGAAGRAAVFLCEAEELCGFPGGGQQRCAVELVLEGQYEEPQGVRASPIKWETQEVGALECLLMVSVGNIFKEDSGTAAMFMEFTLSWGVGVCVFPPVSPLPKQPRALTH